MIGFHSIYQEDTKTASTVNSKSHHFSSFSPSAHGWQRVQCQALGGMGQPCSSAMALRMDIEHRAG